MLIYSAIFILQSCYSATVLSDDLDREVITQEEVDYINSAQDL